MTTTLKKGRPANKPDLLKNVPAWFLKEYYSLEIKGEYQEPITVLNPDTLQMTREDIGRPNSTDAIERKPEYARIVIGEIYQQFGQGKAGEAWQFLTNLFSTHHTKQLAREKVQTARLNERWPSLTLVTVKSLRYWFIYNWNLFGCFDLTSALMQGGGGNYPDSISCMLIGWLLIERPDALFTLSIRQAWRLARPMAENAIKLHELNQKWGKPYEKD